MKMRCPPALPPTPPSSPSTLWKFFPSFTMYEISLHISTECSCQLIRFSYFPLNINCLLYLHFLRAYITSTSSSSYMQFIQNTYFNFSQRPAQMSSLYFPWSGHFELLVLEASTTSGLGRDQPKCRLCLF